MENDIAVQSQDSSQILNGHSKTSGGLQDAASFGQLVKNVIAGYDNPTALNYYADEKWHSISTQEMIQNIKEISLGLISLGLKPGQALGLLGESSPFWTLMDLGNIVAGGITVPFFTNISEPNFEFQRSNADVNFFFIAGEEEWKAYRGRVDQFDVVIRKNSFSQQEKQDFEGLRTQILDFEQLRLKGRELGEEKPKLFDELLDRSKGDDLLTIIYTSGSTGTPKGVELTHENLMTQMKGCASRMPRSLGIDRALTCLPTAHVFERMIVYYYISFDISLYYADDIKNVGNLVRQVKPQMMSMVPRLLEKVYEAMLNRLRQAGFVKKNLGKLAFSLAYKQRSILRPLLSPIFDLLVYNKLREALGGQMRALILGGAPLSPSLGRFFTNVGVPIFQGYGMTESSPVISVNYPGFNKMGSVGPAFPGVEIRLGDNSEVLVKGSSVMRGYHKNDQATSQTLVDGWLHTGDKGTIDNDGFLTITGRLKEFLKTSNGKYISPIPIEQALCKSMLVEMAMVVAEGRKFPSCLLFMNMEELKKRATKHQIDPIEDYLASNTLNEEIEQVIARVNRKLNRWEQIRKFELVPHPISVETGELTPTMKVKRFAVSDKYSELIESMYQEGE